MSHENTNEVHRFFCEAMACTWEAFITGETFEYSEQAAWAAFEEVRRLEYELSRFISSSDVTRIRCAQAGEEVSVGLATLECLQLARDVHYQTGGAFDVTLGNVMEERRDENGLIAAPEVTASFQSQMSRLIFDEKSSSVRVRESDIHLDLGAIGKGYALDESAKILRDWSIESALLCSGQSTFLATGNAAADCPWKIALRNPLNDEGLIEVQLRDCAISGSGMILHGQHIIDPRSGLPARGKLGAWAVASSAALSDALSTAFMVMSVEEIGAYCREQPGIAALVLRDDGALMQWGQSEGFAIT